MLRAPKRFWSALSLVGPALGYTAAVFVGGSLSGGKAYFTMWDKELHAVAYGVMVAPLVRALRFFRPALTLPVRLVVAAAVSSVLGGLLELWQALLPHQDADVFDWFADTIGATVAASMLAIFALLLGVLGTARSE